MLIVTQRVLKLGHLLINQLPLCFELHNTRHHSAICKEWRKYFRCKPVLLALKGSDLAFIQTVKNDFLKCQTFVLPQSVVLDQLGGYVYVIQSVENWILFFIHILSLYLQELPVHVSELGDYLRCQVGWDSKLDGK